MIPVFLIKPLIILATIGSLVGYHFYRVSSLESALEEMTNKYKTVSIATDIQTNEVQRLEMIGKQYGVMLEKAAKQNEEDNKRWEKIIGGIRVTPVPKDCEGAFRHLRNSTSTLSEEYSK